MNTNTNTTTVQPVVPQIGDIFHMSWGYDQTNNDFFQVTRLSKSGVFVRQIGSKSAGGEGFMCQNVVAVKDNFLEKAQWTGGFNGNPETFRRIKHYADGKPYFSIRGRYFACLWDGKPTYESWYA
jgi:hypothetical protein